MAEQHTRSLARSQSPVIGWCCSYFPVEILESAGIVPFRLLPLPPAEMGDPWLNPNFCPYVRAVMGEGLSDAYPFLSGLVIMNTCDGMRRLFDAWSHFRKLPFLHLMDLPRQTGPAALKRFRDEIEHLTSRVTDFVGSPVSGDVLKASFRASNRSLRLHRHLRDLRGQGRLNLKDSEMVELLRAGGILPRKMHDALIERVIRDCVGGEHPQGIPILLTGSVLENTEIVSIIEACGGRIVAEDLCVSSRRSDEPISLKEAPLTALARHYLLSPPCARMQETQIRMAYLLDLIASSKARGVIYYVLKFCDTFLYEAPVLKLKLDQLGIPMILIESEYRRGRGGGVETRIQAFLEMLDRPDMAPFP